jgi:hypothetical protein
MEPVTALIIVGIVLLLTIFESGETRREKDGNALAFIIVGLIAYMLISC